MPLRRTGTVPNAGARYGPGLAAHHAVKNGALRSIRGTQLYPCPGRDAAFFMPLRRAGTVPNAGARYGPGLAAHHAAKSAALRSIRGTHLYRVPDAMRHSSCRFAEPGPYQAPVFGTAPA